MPKRAALPLPCVSTALGVGAKTVPFRAVLRYITHAVIHGAVGCTEPLKGGTVAVISAAGATVAECEFETAEGTFEAVAPLRCRVDGQYEVRISFGSSWGKNSANVDVGMVAVVGKTGAAVESYDDVVTVPAGGLLPAGEPTAATEAVHKAFVEGKVSRVLSARHTNPLAPSLLPD